MQRAARAGAPPWLRRLLTTPADSDSATFAGPSSITLEMLERAEGRARRSAQCCTRRHSRSFSTVLRDQAGSPARAAWPPALATSAGILPLRSFCEPLQIRRGAHNVPSAPGEASEEGATPPLAESQPAPSWARVRHRASAHHPASRGARSKDVSGQQARSVGSDEQGHGKAPASLEEDADPSGSSTESVAQPQQEPETRFAYLPLSAATEAELVAAEQSREWRIPLLRTFLKLGVATSRAVPRVPPQHQSRIGHPKHRPTVAKVSYGDIGLALCDSIQQIAMSLQLPARQAELAAASGASAAAAPSSLQQPARSELDLSLLDHLHPLALPRLAAVLSGSAYRLIERLPMRNAGWKARHLSRSREALRTGGETLVALADYVLERRVPSAKTSDPAKTLLWMSIKVRGLAYAQDFEGAQRLLAQIADEQLASLDTASQNATSLSLEHAVEHLGFSTSYLIRTYTASDLVANRRTTAAGLPIPFRQVRLERRSAMLRWLSGQPRLLELVSATKHWHLQGTFAELVVKTWPFANELVFEPADGPANLALLGSVLNALLAAGASSDALALEQRVRASGAGSPALSYMLLDHMLYTQPDFLRDQKDTAKRLIDASIASVPGERGSDQRSEILRQAARFHRAASALARMGEMNEAIAVLERERDLRASSAMTAWTRAEYLRQSQALRALSSGADADPLPDQKVAHQSVAALQKSFQEACELDDVATVDSTLQQLMAYGKATADVLSKCVTMYLRLNRTGRAIYWLHRAHKLGSLLNKAILTSTLAFLARRGSRAGIDWILDLARTDPKLRDAQLFTAAMDGYVAAQREDMALTLFDELKDSPNAAEQPDVAAYNVALDALARSGAKKAALLEHVAEMRRARVQPDAFTFSLLLGALVRLGDVPAAEDAFAEMILMGKEPVMLHYAIMVGGYLRGGQWRDADYWFAEMQLRTEEAGPDAAPDPTQELARESLAQTARFVGAEGISQLSTELGVIMAEALRDESAKQSLAEDAPADQPIEEFDIRHGTLLLDRYRQAGLVERMISTWNRVFNSAASAKEQRQKVVNVTVSGQEHDFKPWPLENELCVALSIIVDGLSEAGRHGDVARIWSEVRRMGYGFDAHNWNTLLIALTRAGRYEDAFRIVENVLIEDGDRRDERLDPATIQLRSRLADAVSSPVRRLKPVPRGARRAEELLNPRAATISATFASMSHHTGWYPYNRAIAVLEPIVDALRRGQNVSINGDNSPQSFITIRDMQDYYPRTLRKVNDLQAMLLRMDSRQAIDQQQVDERLT